VDESLFFVVRIRNFVLTTTPSTLAVNHKIAYKANQTNHTGIQIILIINAILTTGNPTITASHIRPESVGFFLIMRARLSRTFGKKRNNNQPAISKNKNQIILKKKKNQNHRECLSFSFFEDLSFWV